MIKIVPSTCVGTLFTTCFYTLFPNHIAPKMFQSSEVKSSKSWQYVLHSTSQMSSVVALQEEKTGELLGRTAWCHEATDPLTLTGPKWPCWSTEYSTFKIKPKKTSTAWITIPSFQQIPMPFLRYSRNTKAMLDCSSSNAIHGNLAVFTQFSAGSCHACHHRTVALASANWDAQQILVSQACT